MRLSNEQVVYISTIVAGSSINIKTLKDDVVDHLCCVVEIKVENGTPFEIALQEALQEVAPNGLDALQIQTLNLLQSSKSILMKKIMFAVGFICSISVSLGWLFVTLGWLGGRQLFNFGFLGLLLLFIPMVALHRFKISIQKTMSEKVRILLGSISGFIIGLSLVCKVLHLYGADILLVIGVLLFTFGFLPFLFFNLYQKSATGEVPGSI